MTLPTLITLFRLLLVPVFAVMAVTYAKNLDVEWLRWGAILVFILAAALDGLDGWLARKLRKESLMGAILDPLTDKALLLTGITTFTLIDWGPGWEFPLWFLTLVILRDVIIIVGIWILYFINRRVPIKPHWSGKVCTVTQMVALGWIMLKFLGISPFLPTVIAAIFTVGSGWAYIQTGISQLPRHKHRRKST